MRRVFLLLALILSGCSDEEFCIHHVGVDNNGSPYSYYTGSCGINNVIETSDVTIQFDNSFLEWMKEKQQ